MPRFSYIKNSNYKECVQYEQIEQIMGESMEKYKDNSTDTMLNFKRRNTAKAIAEEIVIKDFVLLSR